MNFGVQTLEATLTGIKLPNGPQIDRFTLASGKASLVTEPFSLKLDSPAKARATVSEDSLRQFLELKSPGGLKGFKVKIENGSIYVTAGLRVVLVDVPVKARCTLEIVDGAELHVRLQAVDVAGGGAKSLVEGQIEKQNPILSTKDLPFPIVLTDVELEAGAIVLDGEAR